MSVIYLQLTVFSHQKYPQLKERRYDVLRFGSTVASRFSEGFESKGKIH